MAEEGDSSLDVLGAEGNCTKEAVSPQVQNGSTAKADSTDSKEKMNTHNERLELPENKGKNSKKGSSGRSADSKGETSGAAAGRSKLRMRCYRPRLLESSSSESEETTTLCEGPKSPEESEVCPDDESLDLVREDRGDTSADTSRDTETDPMEPTSPSAMETGSAASGNSDNEDESPVRERPRERRRSRQTFGGLFSDTDSDPDEGRRRSSGVASSIEDEVQRKELEEAVERKLKKLKEMPKPKHKFNFVEQIINRQIESRARYQSSVLFSHHYYDSLHVPKRLELMYKMQFHRGCVNALSFNPSGSRLASGSDDFQIAVWDWAREKSVLTFYSGHRNNVFQSKFLPFTDDTHIVSCARDGQVRLAELSSTGTCKSTRKLAKHHGPAHKLATMPTSPHVVLSAGEDAVVLNIDIRQEQPSRIALVKGVSGSRISLYSIHAHPVNEHQYCVSGHDQYVRVYDRRCGTNSFPAFKYCPRHLYDVSQPPTVTCAVYSSNGDAILASYNDDDIYLFDTSLSEGADAAHRYYGHRNNATVKGVNFFGPGSQYVVSGSDCGNIFFWHRETEAIVQCMPGDENGVVNVLEPHPHIPVLATSGLDDDIKIWVPTCEDDPELKTLEQTVKTNLMKRDKERNEEFTGLDPQMLMVLWHHIQRTERRRHRASDGGGGAGGGGGEGGNGTGGSSSDESNDSDDSEGRRGGVQCATH